METPVLNLPVGVVRGHFVPCVRMRVCLILADLVMSVPNTTLNHPQLDSKPVPFHRHLVAVLSDTEAADPPLQVAQLLLDPGGLGSHGQRLRVVLHRARCLVPRVRQWGDGSVRGVHQMGHRHGLHALLDVAVDKLGVESRVVLEHSGSLRELQDRVVVLHHQHVLRVGTGGRQRLAQCRCGPGVETKTGGDSCRLCIALELPGFPRNWAEPKRTMAKPKYTPNVWLVMVFGGGLGWVGFAGLGRVGMVRIGVVGWQDG